MPWICFCSSTLHSLIDLMKKKPGPASWMWDSRYPMWLPPFCSGRAWGKMLWLSWYSCSSCSSCFHFLTHWHFSCCSSVSSTSELVATVGSLLPPSSSSFLFLLLVLLCPIVISFAFSFTAGGAGPFLFDGQLSSLVWHKELFAQCLFTLFRVSLMDVFLDGMFLGNASHDRLC